MNEITILIIGIGVGYFWAMYRKDNIVVKPLIHNFMDVKAFWQAAEEWRKKEGQP